MLPRPSGEARRRSRDIARDRSHIADVQAEPDYPARGTRGGGLSKIVSVPLMREGVAIGGIGLHGPPPDSFPERQIALLQTFAEQAVIAIENVRLFDDVQARTAILPNRSSSRPPPPTCSRSSAAPPSI